MCKKIQTITYSFFFVCFASLPFVSSAQNANDHQHMQGTAEPSMTEGEIKKIDFENGKLSIKHGDIHHLNMPAMTMVLTVKDKNMITNLKVGDKIKFMVLQESGKLLITEIQAEK